MSRVLLIGATGLTGSYVLRLLCADPRVCEIIAPTRRALLTDDKLHNPVAEELSALLRQLERPIDKVFCCLGTTRKQAGSRRAFIYVDHQLVVESGLAGRRLGAQQMLVVSAHGADKTSALFYYRVKGEMEEALLQQNWPQLTLLRPSLLLGDRRQKRTGEGIIAPVMKRAPGNWRAVKASDVAQTMLNEAWISTDKTVRIIASAQLRLT